MAQRSLTLQQVINNALDRRLLAVRTSFPGIVQKYDPATQLADIQPCPRDRVEGEDGIESVERLPVIPNVPIAHPAGGGMFLHLPIQIGDEVWVVCTDRALDTWLSRGGEYTPEDMRTHTLKDAWAFPGAHSVKAPLQGAEANVITLGSSTASSAQFVALADKVKACLDALKGHTHSVTGVQAGGATLGTTAAASGIDTNVASATVKIRG